MPDEIRWHRLPDEVRAHAFVSGPGWMRSLCESVRWTVRLQPEPDLPWRSPSAWHPCGRCVTAINARRRIASLEPIEPVMDEAEARLVFGR